MAEAVRNDTEAGEAIVTVEGVSQSFGAIDVLEDISFTIAAGSVTAIVGPNGSGKTTLSKIIAGLTAPSSGQVTIRAATERPVGYLPQEPQFRPVFTVEETLEFYAELLSDTPPPEDTMEQVGLRAVRDRRVDALSGGMRRLLGLAQGFLGSPSLVILDEPTSGLDPRMTRRIFDVVETLADQGTAILITTHDLTHAGNADQLVVLHQGRVISQGAPDTILEQTRSDSLSEAFFSMVGTDPTVQSGVADEQ